MDGNGKRSGEGSDADLTVAASGFGVRGTSSHSHCYKHVIRAPQSELGVHDTFHLFWKWLLLKIDLNQLQFQMIYL